MASEVKITDLVDQETIDKIKELNKEIYALLDTYQATAVELAKGLAVPVKNMDELDKLTELVGSSAKKASDQTKQLNTVVGEYNATMGQTTNVISRNLMEVERSNKLNREAYTEQDKVKKLLEHFHDTYEDQLVMLNKYNNELEANKKAQNANKKALKENSITVSEYNAKQVELIAKQRELTVARRNLQQIMTKEEKMMQSQEGGYAHMSQQLELLKIAYKDLNEEGKNNEFGEELGSAIQNLDAHLKDEAAYMGEFQRNVGNYAIAGQNGVVSTESLIAVLDRQAVTMKDVADQTKILEEAKAMMDSKDSQYEETLSRINAQLDENRARLTDISDIMDVQAKTVSEAEAQNKRLEAALKNVDMTSADAQEKIDKLNEKMEANNKLIEDATPSMQKRENEMKNLQKALDDLEKKEKEWGKEIDKTNKANDDAANKMLSLIGINSKFGSSVQNLNVQGSVFEGLNSKVQGLGKTLLGLLANPWVLAFLGIAGVAMGFKWWYDYNKGMEEASRLTENFTGATGEAADKVAADVKVLADHMGKGFDETIGAANTLVQHFGISWEEAIQRIQDGIEAGADLSGNMLANIDRFGPSIADAGLQVDEFIALLAETRNGIFSEEGVQDIMKAGTKLKSMTKQTAASLDAVGISSEKLAKDLSDGTISMMDAVQMVSAKISELPENSQEAGNLIKNVFGKTAAEGGMKLVESIANVNTNLDKSKESMNELGKVTHDEIEAEKELHETVAALFKMSGTGFEVMTKKAKTYVTKGLTAIVKGIVDIINWFINLYNESLVVRLAVQSIANGFKTVWEVGKFVIKYVIDSFKAVGTMVEGVLTLNWDKIKQGWQEGLESLKNNVSVMVENIVANTANALQKGLQDEIKPISIPANIEIGGEKTDDPIINPGNPTNDDNKKGKGGDKTKKNAEKDAKEQLKILEQLEESKLALMVDGQEKEILQIRLKFKKKLDTIKGNGDKEMELRLSIAEECEREVAACEEKYRIQMAKINFENRLATVKKGSQEELALKLAQLERQREEEIKEAEKTGADLLLIEAKYQKLRKEMQEEYASNRMQDIEKQYADEATSRNTDFIVKCNSLKKQYAEQLKLAGNNTAKREQAEKKYQRKLERLQAQYAIDTVAKEIEKMEKMLDVSDLSADERYKIEQGLAEKKAELQEKQADLEIKMIEDGNSDYQDLLDKRIAATQYWLSVASDALNAFNDLSSAVFDAQIERIEALQEANEEASEKEMERIQDLCDKKVISEEEAEARKRAAEAKTAKENEKLEKKKAELKRKQAMWDKANSVAQAAIATALSLVQLWAEPGWPAAIPMMTVVAGLGALQIATILATPIPQYKMGTDSHKGGPAIVGDGGRSELVLYNGGAWVTICA